MKQWEYETRECSPEEVFDVLNVLGLDGWEFVNLIMIQKTIQHPPPAVHSFSQVQKQPEIVTTFRLIFKRQKE